MNDTRDRSGDLMPDGPVEILLLPRTSEIGDGFTVKRALPSSRRRMVGPFIFLDQMGPEIIRGGQALDVAPHPHIGLATVTYLFEGELLHRDSTGVRQPIVPGEVNWMTAGKGIAHSERTAERLRSNGGSMFGLQSWVALPLAQEESEPTLVHHDEGDLPVVEGEGVRARVIAGGMFGVQSKVATLSDLFYVDAWLEPGATLTIDPHHEERAIYIVEGEATVRREERRFGAGELLILRPGVAVDLVAGERPLHAMLLGGAAMDGPRHIWWNFVSSSRERIEQAKRDWQEDRFGRVPDEHEFIPLPGDPRGERVEYP